MQREPYLVWNAFVDIVALTPYERLHPRQRPAHLVFWYNAEVQNGGHYQYFENSAGRRAHEAGNEGPRERVSGEDRQSHEEQNPGDHCRKDADRGDRKR